MLHENETETACDHITENITLNFERQDESLQIDLQKEVLDCISLY